jgi:hypothetical protein
MHCLSREVWAGQHGQPTSLPRALKRPVSPQSGKDSLIQPRCLSLSSLLPFVRIEISASWTGSAQGPEEQCVSSVIPGPCSRPE